MCVGLLASVCSSCFARQRRGRPPRSASTRRAVRPGSTFAVSYHFDPGQNGCPQGLQRTSSAGTPIPGPNATGSEGQPMGSGTVSTPDSVATLSGGAPPQKASVGRKPPGVGVRRQWTGHPDFAEHGQRSTGDLHDPGQLDDIAADHASDHGFKGSPTTTRQGHADHPRHHTPGPDFGLPGETTLVGSRPSSGTWPGGTQGPQSGGGGGLPPLQVRSLGSNPGTDAGRLRRARPVGRRGGPPGRARHGISARPWCGRRAASALGAGHPSRGRGRRAACGSAQR